MAKRYRCQTHAARNVFVRLSVFGCFWSFAQVIQGKLNGIACVCNRDRVLEEEEGVKRKRGKRFCRQILFARKAYDVVPLFIRAEDFTVVGRGLGKNFRA